MSTENRSSNTEQMVSVPASKLKKIHRDLDACQKVIWLRGGFDPAYCKDAQDSLKEIDALLDQPAAQHQGEPVMKLEAEKLLGGDGEYAVSFMKAGWLQECRTKGGTFLLYTHADAGEVEQLRDNLTAWMGLASERLEMTGTLGAQLSESTAANQTLRGLLVHARAAAHLDGDLRARIDEVLRCPSTSAEPAPSSDGFNAEQMTVQGAGGYRNGIKAAAELAADYPELAQAIRDLPLPQ